METWTIFGWVIFCLALSWVICTNISLRQHYKSSDVPALPANATAMAQSGSVLAISVFGYSPFNLLWLLPLSYLVGFLALRSRVVGRAVWLYGYFIAYTVPSNW